MYDRILGAEHPDTVWARCYLASAYRNANLADQAIELAEAVVHDSERELGPEHSETISCRAVLADAYHDRGRLAEALELAAQVVTARELVLGAQHPHTLDARSRLEVLATPARGRGSARRRVAAQRTAVRRSPRGRAARRAPGERSGAQHRTAVGTRCCPRAVAAGWPTSRTPGRDVRRKRGCCPRVEAAERARAGC